MCALVCLSVVAGAVVQEDGWSKKETDELCRLCSHFELRWPVIADRFVVGKERPLEELQVGREGGRWDTIHACLQAWLSAPVNTQD